EEAAFIVADILSDRAGRAVTFGLDNPLVTRFWSAVKTGTSKDMRDNWCIGYTDRYTVGVWVGNFNGQPMWDVSGVSGAAPVWREVMDFMHRERPGRQGATPHGLVRQAVAYAPAHEPAREEWFLRGTETALVEAVPAGRRTARIIYPADGSILAVDPDIPDRVERVLFQAQGVQGHRWRLDGRDEGLASDPFAWRPLAGEHRIELVDAAGKTVSASRFEVRGN
ncbi:MAG: penicillin-binding protein 1C, partial [Telluria sp.]